MIVLSIGRFSSLGHTLTGLFYRPDRSANAAVQKRRRPYTDV
jgi:hypothetical protein